MHYLQSDACHTIARLANMFESNEYRFMFWEKNAHILYLYTYIITNL